VGVSVTHDGHLVRREPYDNGSFVRRVLRLLKARGFDGAPRFAGVDDEARETVAFVRGNVYASELLRSSSADVVGSFACERQAAACRIWQHGRRFP
jgi:hypothetical protein